MAGTADLIAAYGELCDARPAYAKAQSFYDGDVDELFASDAMARLLAKSHLNELDEVNFARIPVTAVLNRLHITAVTTDDAAANDEIVSLFQRNQLDQEGPVLHERVCSLGDAYLMVWPALADDGTVEAVDVFVHGPGTVRVIYDEENPLRKRLAIKSWCIGSGKNQVVRADLYYADRIERFVWQGRYSDKRDQWEPYTSDGQDAVLANPWGIPFFHFRTGRPYGRPQHFAAYGPQTIINKIVVSHAATVDYQSLPQRYGLIDPTVDQSGAQGADFDPDFPEDAAADPEGAGNSSQLRSDPGEFWQLQGYREVGQFAAADPDVYLKPLDRYIKAMAQVTETPFHIFDSTGAVISGESRREADAPLLARVEALQRALGAAWADAIEFALRLLGFDDTAVTVRWKPAEQVTDADGWTTVSAKINAGVPRQQALTETGYEPEQVAGWLENLDDDAELMRRADLLEKIGNAVQALGTGVQLGAVTAEQVDGLLGSVLGAAVRLSQEEAP
ncbi:hypothetical protein ABZ419_11465 [Streptomyces cinnamoneus]|uniref:hypothetical protein n=1 Tax=Streptomyces cinnamoneus TaxID=53446 RepID=UPI0033F70CCF